MWALACSDCAYSCMSDLQVYLAKQGNSENGLAHRVVTDLCLPNLGPTNHVVYMDNFFHCYSSDQTIGEYWYL